MPYLLLASLSSYQVYIPFLPVKQIPSILRQRASPVQFRAFLFPYQHDVASSGVFQYFHVLQLQPSWHGAHSPFLQVLQLITCNFPSSCPSSCSLRLCIFLFLNAKNKVHVRNHQHASSPLPSAPQNSTTRENQTGFVQKFSVRRSLLDSWPHFPSVGFYSFNVCEFCPLQR